MHENIQTAILWHYIKSLYILNYLKVNIKNWHRRCIGRGDVESDVLWHHTSEPTSHITFYTEIEALDVQSKRGRSGRA